MTIFNKNHILNTVSHINSTLRCINMSQTCCIELVDVATTNIVVKTTIARSVKLLTSKKKEKWPTNTNIKP